MVQEGKDKTLEVLRPTGSGIIYRRFSGGDSSNMQMSVGKLLMGYLGIGLTAFVIGYSIRKGGTAAK